MFAAKQQRIRAPFSLARLAWGFLEPCSQPSPPTSETRGEACGAPCLPAVSQALSLRAR